jgi:hypothetical protein
MNRTIYRGSSENLWRSGAGVDNGNLLKDCERLPAQRNLGALSCNRASQEDARIAANVRQLLDVRVGRFHACRAQQETFTMRFSERTVDQTDVIRR